MRFLWFLIKLRYVSNQLPFKLLRFVFVSRLACIYCHRRRVLQQRSNLAFPIAVVKSREKTNFTAFDCYVQTNTVKISHGKGLYLTFECWVTVDNAVTRRSMSQNHLNTNLQGKRKQLLAGFRRTSG